MERTESIYSYIRPVRAVLVCERKQVVTLLRKKILHLKITKRRCSNYYRWSCSNNLKSKWKVMWKLVFIFTHFRTILPYISLITKVAPKLNSICHRLRRFTTTTTTSGPENFSVIHQCGEIVWECMVIPVLHIKLVGDRSEGGRYCELRLYLWTLYTCERWMLNTFSHIIFQVI